MKNEIKDLITKERFDETFNRVTTAVPFFFFGSPLLSILVIYWIITQHILYGQYMIMVPVLSLLQFLVSVGCSFFESRSVLFPVDPNGKLHTRTKFQGLCAFQASPWVITLLWMAAGAVLFQYIFYTINFADDGRILYIHPMSGFFKFLVVLLGIVGASVFLYLGSWLAEKKGMFLNPFKKLDDIVKAVDWKKVADEPDSLNDREKAYLIELAKYTIMPKHLDGLETGIKINASRFLNKRCNLDDKNVSRAFLELIIMHLLRGVDRTYFYNSNQLIPALEAYLSFNEDIEDPKTCGWFLKAHGEFLKNLKENKEHKKYYSEKTFRLIEEVKSRVRVVPVMSPLKRRLILAFLSFYVLAAPVLWFIQVMYSPYEKKTGTGAHPSPNMSKVH